ncbi:hypothetical protein HMPREF9554_01803 [Treponema phagedenis F0421]|nr:hypothetical protein HMPREF9554_01803 [Treponema phagedenis F0421]
MAKTKPSVWNHHDLILTSLSKLCLASFKALQITLLLLSGTTAVRGGSECNVCYSCLQWLRV